MGEQQRPFERAQAYQAAHADEVAARRHRLNLMTAGLLAILGAGALLGAIVAGSWVAALGGLVALAGPSAWLRGDRARTAADAEQRNGAAHELGWVLLAIALVAGGYAFFVTALVRGW